MGNTYNGNNGYPSHGDYTQLHCHTLVCVFKKQDVEKKRLDSKLGPLDYEDNALTTRPHKHDS